VGVWRASDEHATRWGYVKPDDVCAYVADIVCRIRHEYRKELVRRVISEWDEAWDEARQRKLECTTSASGGAEQKASEWA